MRNVLCLLLMVGFVGLVVGCGERPAAPPEREGVDAEVETPAPAADKFVLRVICGSDVEYKDPAGNVWQADKDFVEGGWGRVGGSSVTREIVDKIENTELHKVYLTELYGLEAYRITCPNGKYSVTLHFAETFHEDPGVRIFDVTLEDKKVLTAFDPTKEAGKALKAVVKKFDVEVTDGELTIGFVEDTENPLINGIEVIQK